MKQVTIIKKYDIIDINDASGYIIADQNGEYPYILKYFNKSFYWADLLSQCIYTSTPYKTEKEAIIDMIKNESIHIYVAEDEEDLLNWIKDTYFPT